jgi:hypothetical protein
MKASISFLKITVVDGLLVVLLLWVSLLLLAIAKLLPQSVVHEKVTALLLLLLICFVVGLFIRTEIGKLIGDWLERNLLGRLPGFPFILGVIGQLAGKKMSSHSTGPSGNRGRTRAGIYYRKVFRRAAHHIHFIESHTHGRGNLHFATRTGASRGCATGHKVGGESR